MIKADWMRPALKASLSDFAAIDEYHESPAFDENVELSDRDFRGHPYELNEREADSGKQMMKQLSSPREADAPYGELDAPSVSELPESSSASDDEQQNALRCVDPIPHVDHHATLNLNLEDAQRPLSKHVGKVLCETIRSLFHAESVGDFNFAGASSRQTDSGEYVETSCSFFVGLQKEAETALRFLREALWWLGAPESTDIEGFSLNLNQEPFDCGAGFLQLARPEIVGWSTGCRIDRVAFSMKQREWIENQLVGYRSDNQSGETALDGWTVIEMSDGGVARAYDKDLLDQEEFATLNVVIQQHSPELSRCIDGLMREGGLMLFPMSIAASPEVARLIDDEWSVRVVESRELHDILTSGPYARWCMT